MHSFRHVKDGDFSIARNGWISDYNDPVSFLDMWVTGGGNTMLSTLIRITIT